MPGCTAVFYLFNLQHQLRGLIHKPVHSTHSERTIVSWNTFYFFLKKIPCGEEVKLCLPFYSNTEEELLKTYRSVYSKLLRAEKTAPLLGRVVLYMELLQQLTLQTGNEDAGSRWRPYYSRLQNKIKETKVGVNSAQSQAALKKANSPPAPLNHIIIIVFSMCIAGFELYRFCFCLFFLNC